MIDENNISGTIAQASAGKALTEEQLKTKYGKTYRVGMVVPVDDETQLDYTYHFKRPSVPSYDRYIKSAAQIGITKASKVFMLDNVIDEDKERLEKDMEENPGIAISVGNKLTEILGLTQAVNLKML